MSPTEILAGLNPAQRDAVEHGDSPLLIVAGAGTGKTKTLVHRVARLIESGADPSRILLMTFTRRAAQEMLRRVAGLLESLSRQAAKSSSLVTRRVWGGTFHATATRLLRQYGDRIGLAPNFTIHDRGDSEDLLDLVRTDLNLAKTDKRFPKKGTCLAIYSNSVNSRDPLPKILEDQFPWCADYEDDLKRLFHGYTDRKEHAAVLDYDDLLVFFHALLSDKSVGDEVRARFEFVLVDEYQDTNRLQSEIVQLLAPRGHRLTAVGDDAQSIYSFRAATVRNILDFPRQFPGTRVIKLEQNYRSTSPILKITNSVIAESRERYEKKLWTSREGGEAPRLVTCEDENEQADYVVRHVLERRELGVALKNQAVLFRAAHHSIVLEAELTRAKIPFVKYGGLRFLEAAHIKDLMAFLRLAENPKDAISGVRVLSLLPGIGGKTAQQLLQRLAESGWDARAWERAAPPSAAKEHWPRFVKLYRRLQQPKLPLAGQIDLVRQFYEPLLEEKYDNATMRIRDLEQMEQIASRYEDRAVMLAEITLDPPNSTEELAADPLLDEDYLILSTIHSAKGLEWDSVYVLHAADGNIPSDMATRNAEQVEEERRLFYVALTRARNALHVCYPLRYYQGHRGNFSDRYGMAQLTRFVTPKIRRLLECHQAHADLGRGPKSAGHTSERAVRNQLRSQWS